MNLFDACELGIASISIYEDQCPGTIEALKYWANDRKHSVIEHTVKTAGGGSYVAYRVQFGLHQILVYGHNTLPH